jgi:alanyl-tRNA synthetase
MKKLTTNELRAVFLRFFEGHGHAVVPSSPTVPTSDPTLLFTNAGMNQFKSVFLGQTAPPYNRVASSQKCMRAGGKHNDLEEVGVSPWHHTLFEMLGNFSFGDYFKKEAIAFAWEFIVDTLQLPTERLWATVYLDDDEAFELWTEHLPSDRVVRLGEKDNFWAMGETGPCGPCSEIHFDSGQGPTGGPEVDEDRFTEIWNLVFIQFNRSLDGTLSPLPTQNVDTGMGLERVAALLQEVDSTYDIDLFDPIKSSLFDLCGVRYDDAITSYRVVCDHLRALAFTISDGVVPSNEGRGYVMRRILRRAARHGRLLGLHEPFLSHLLPSLVSVMGEAYPELDSQSEHISRVLTHEEERFGRTLDSGLELFEKVASKIEQGGVFPGADAFRLYDTYGFPLDLTEVMARERDFSVDISGFDAAMQEQRERSRAASSFVTDEGWEDYTGEVPKEPTGFVGYDSFEANANLLAYKISDGEAELVFDKTPFHAEAGGQVSDTGVAEPLIDKPLVINITYVFKRGDIYVHRVEYSTSVVKLRSLSEPIGTVWNLRVEPSARLQIMRHHTATHLLHRALHKVVGENTVQAGSHVAPDRLRFDFQHDRALTDQELREVEDEVNARVLDNLPVSWRELPIDDARELGAMALFGEKYADVVRVVTVGSESDAYSRELCGGTHVKSTGEIGQVKLISESAIAAGVRRIEAVAGTASLMLSRRHTESLDEIGRELGVLPTEAHGKVVTLQRALKEESRKVRELSESLGRGGGGLSEERVGNALLVFGEVPTVDRGTLRSFADGLRPRLSPGVAILAAEVNSKAAFLVVVSDDLVGRGVKAGDIVKVAAETAGGGGGGKPTLAEAGGKDPSRIGDAIEAAAAHVRSVLSGDDE